MNVTALKDLNITGKALNAYRTLQAKARAEVVLNVFGLSILESEDFALNADEFALEGMSFKWESSFPDYAFPQPESLMVKSGTVWLQVKSLAHLGQLILSGKVEAY
jgi:hypothetical protein